MALDLSYIRQTTNREAEELSVKRTGNRFADRCLANARRPNKADDFALDCSPKLTHCEELQYAVFNVFEAIMVFIENFLSVCDGEVLGCMLAPWYL